MVAAFDYLAFIKELQALVAKWIPHNHITSIQGKAIYTEKRCERKGSLVLHFHFGENWTVVLPSEVQTCYRHKKQVSVITCVATTQKRSRNLAVISDDVRHESAHACFEIAKVPDWLDDNDPIHSQATYVVEGAASQFKNRYQVHEFRKLRYPAAKCMFPATGHGKNACDGVGGLVKHQATIQNLRKPKRKAIQNVRDMSRELFEHLKGICVIHIDGSQLLDFRNQKEG